MYYLQSRYYDPENGRFINADTIAGNTGNSTFNLFVYCANNPVNNVDPTGRATQPHYTPGCKSEVDNNGNLVVTNTHTGVAKTYVQKKSASYTVGQGTAANNPDLNGPPNSWRRINKTNWRYFGEDGRASYDRHYKDHYGKIPHTHEWNWDDNGNAMQNPDPYQEEYYPDINEEPKGPPQPRPGTSPTKEFSLGPVPEVDWEVVATVGTVFLALFIFLQTGDPSMLSKVS